MQNGFLNHEPNRRIATALVVEANLGIRISDIARKLTLSNIIRDGGRYRLDIIEQKTKKKRTFTVPVELYIYLQSYCLENKIAPDEVIFPISERAIQNIWLWSVIIWARITGTSAPILFANTLPPASTTTTGRTSPWFSGYCSTAHRRRLSGISASSRSGSRKHWKPI